MKTMRNPLKRVKELIAVLPEKDSKLVKEYIDKRDFDSALEIVESDIYKAEKEILFFKELLHKGTHIRIVLETKRIICTRTSAR